MLIGDYMYLGTEKLQTCVCDSIRESAGITEDELKSLLQAKKVELADEDFFGVISDLLIEDGCILRDDTWNRGAIYRYIENEHLHKSSYSRHHYSFTVDDNIHDKKFLVISDTHIGHPEFVDFRLLDAVYNYAIANGASKCFHLGDIFHGPLYGDFSVEDMLKQIREFICDYPNPTSQEMMTYANIGNHDEFLHGFFQLSREHPYSSIFDLRYLNAYHPSFYIIPRPSWKTDFSNVSMHFGHRLYVSGIRREVKLFELCDMKQESRWLDEVYDVLWSGHLHNAFVYTTDFLDSKQRLFLGVPSTSKYNLNGSVAYLADVHYENEKATSMDVFFLHSDNNYRIMSEEGVHWRFHEKNKIMQKML